MFIDVKKAFDSVDHILLLKKLQTIGFRDEALKLMKSYLTNRKQFIFMNDTKSEEIPLKCGVPQGSILGPLLFLIFINDLFQCDFNGVLQLFADDATIVYGELDFNTLYLRMSDDLGRLNDWMTRNRLSINFTKTNFILYYLRNTDTTDSFNHLCFENFKVNRVDKAKYLGLILNTSLSFSEHVDLVKSKISKFVGVLRRISKYVNEPTKLKIYYAYIHSHLNYINSIWSAAPEYKLKELQILQNKAMKQVYSLPYRTPSISLYYKDILPLHCIFDIELNLLVFKVKNKLIKTNLVFVNSNQIHSHLTRISNFLRTTFNRSNCTQNSIFNRGVILFNKLPDDVKNIHEIRSFKHKLKTYTKNSYISNPTI